MDALLLFTSLYCKLRPRKLIPNRLFSPFRFLIRNAMDKYISRHANNYKARAVKHKLERNDVIVSLTSFPARIDNVWKTIYSLKCQTVKTKKIVLWLSSAQFKTIESVPNSLKEYQDDYFEIRLVDGDLRSHKKYYYVMREYPENTVITVDDDIIYHPQTIEYLITASSKNPKNIVANLTNRVLYRDGVITSYKEWSGDNKEYSFKNLVQIGAGGVLYPPHCLDPMVLNESIFMELAPRADDLWLNTMARKAKTKVIQSASKILFMPISDDLSGPKLNEDNVNGGGNDAQLNRIREYFIKSKGEDLFKEDN